VGIVLRSTGDTLYYSAITDMVINNRDDVKTVRDDFKITRDHKRLLIVHQDKDYRIVFDKRVVMIILLSGTSSMRSPR
jgi:hypothetical protein